MNPFISVEEAVWPNDPNGAEPMLEEDGENAAAWQEAFDAAEAKSMAQVFAIILAPGAGLSCLDASVHAHGEVLWQQKVSLGSELEIHPLADAGFIRMPFSSRMQ